MSEEFSLNKHNIIVLWLDGKIGDDELSFYLKHYNKLPEMEHPDQILQ